MRNGGGGRGGFFKWHFTEVRGMYVFHIQKLPNRIDIPVYSNPMMTMDVLLKIKVVANTRQFLPSLRKKKVSLTHEKR